LRSARPNSTSCHISAKFSNASRLGSHLGGKAMISGPGFKAVDSMTA
jgi:hypothetical protein